MALRSNYDRDLDEWGDDNFKSAPKAPKAPVVPLAKKAAAPKMTAEDRRAKAAQNKADEAKGIRSAGRQRKQWEASPEGKKRSRDIVDLATEQHNEMARTRTLPNGGKLKPTNRLAITRAQIYQHLGVTNEGHGANDQQLPGMENPHSAPQPPRWEDLPQAKRAKTEHNMRKVGTNLAKMKEDFGNQLDQSIWRAHMAGHERSSTGEPVPFTAHFYGDHPKDAPEPLDNPRQMLRESRQFLGKRGVDVDPSVQIAVVGHTSPNLKFTQGQRGNRSSPNIEAAESVIQQHHEGVHSSDVVSGENRRGVTNQTRPANARRAALMMEQVDQGKPLAEARNAPSESSPEGSSQWGPKTGPFANSFDQKKPDFFVGDVHSFGGGMVPHHTTSKPIAINKEGGRDRQKLFKGDPRSDEELTKLHGERNVFRSDKSGREKAMVTMGTTPAVKQKASTGHSAADYAARQAISERGLGNSVRRPQASQWGEEQIQRGEASPKLDVPHHDEAYPSQKAAINPNQFKLFK